VGTRSRNPVWKYPIPGIIEKRFVEYSILKKEASVRRKEHTHPTEHASTPPKTTRSEQKKNHTHQKKEKDERTQHPPHNHTYT